MAGKLVIVESPAKARTLGRILGRSYTVKASVGHVRDLPKANLGVDVDHDFTPKYVVPRDKQKLVNQLKEAVTKASAVYLATDPDREGEAISWHLFQATAGDGHGKPVHRVAFHEITKEAVQEAFKTPHSIDMNLVNAQQTRRVLDRLVGYKLSPLLWKKVQRGLSAGRVQSVAVRIVVDREEEIQAFVPQEYWNIEAELLPKEQHDGRFRARLHGILGNGKLEIGSQSEADSVLADLEAAEYQVTSVIRKDVPRQPAPPFTTSTLQQEAWRKLRFTAKRTMAIAQQLYEGLPLGKEGSVGLITYMRTDSTRVADSAIGETRQFVTEKYGSKFRPAKPRSFSRKAKGAQEAHEAIRPTRVHREPEQLKPFLDQAQLKLYELIWTRMVASQMSAAIYDTTSVDVAAAPPTVPNDNTHPGYLLRASSADLRFPGFMSVYSESLDEDDQAQETASIPELKGGDLLTLLGLHPEQRFTKAPPRYTEATLVKALEQKGIGRPSTYAPTLSTIQDRGYVSKEGGKFHPSELGTIVNKILTENFPNIVDLDFTADMETRLDQIARGEREWVSALRDFYPSFEQMLGQASDRVEKVDLSKVSDESCPKCGHPMLIKVGRFGKYLECDDQDCKHRMPYVVKTGVRCPLPGCPGEMVERFNRKKKTVFYACSNYPEHKFAVSRRPLPQPCPSCGGLLVEDGRGGARCTACKHKLGPSHIAAGEPDPAKAPAAQRPAKRSRSKKG